ncbi:MAG: hypothetical protein ABIE22_03205, partial [archaeon]
PFGEDRDLYNYFLNKSQDCGKRVVAVMPYDSNLPQGGRGIAGLVPSGHRNNSEFIKRDAWAISSDIDNYFRVQREF